MVENILSSLNCKKLYRLDVNFKIESTNFANFIGRTAHILLIECEPFFMSLIYKYHEVFCEWFNFKTHLTGVLFVNIVFLSDILSAAF